MEKKMNGVARLWGMITLCSCMVQLCMGDVCTVGDSAGWTIMNHVDYKTWAAAKTFKVGDIVVFNYNSKFHNVMQVTHAEYKSCNASTPIKTYATGNDSIAITTQGHHFFICGIPGHCQAGQKVDINVIRESLKAPSPSTSSSPPAVAAGLVPAPSPSETTSSAQVSSRFIGSLCMTMALVAAFV